ncbi:MAG: nicotinate-nucleotide--dimethylbenzimidazole phosphoribosyltransferase, partial [Lachnospiraceae bacterium]|nr:nicotinate-nucleotide--dimethylbenzimidazole phosphoribosyltransferase [Lachnospiraceae bacterium]
LDGWITAAAALCANRLAPGTVDTMLASHLGRERGMSLILNELGLAVVLDGDMALGEGTGAVMLFPLLDMALALYYHGKRFSETAVTQYDHYDYRNA